MRQILFASAIGLLLISLTVWCQAVAEVANEDAKTRDSSEAGWKNPLVKKGKLHSPLVEDTPFVFKDHFYLLENWQKQWEIPGSISGDRFQEDEVRIRDVAADRIVSTPLVGHGLGVAYFWKDRVYIFAGNWGTEEKWSIKEIEMTSSKDLLNWTTPVVVLKAEPQEKFFNVSVC